MLFTQVAVWVHSAETRVETVPFETVPSVKAPLSDVPLLGPSQQPPESTGNILILKTYSGAYSLVDGGGEGYAIIDRRGGAYTLIDGRAVFTLIDGGCNFIDRTGVYTLIGSRGAL